jgi:hypothetical protein
MQRRGGQLKVRDRKPPAEEAAPEGGFDAAPALFESALDKLVEKR